MTNTYRVYLVPMAAPLAVGRQLQVSATHHLYNIMDDVESVEQMTGDMYHNAIDTGVTGTWQETHAYCHEHHTNFRDYDVEYTLDNTGDDDMTNHEETTIISNTERLVTFPARNSVTAKSQIREVLCNDGEWEVTHRRFWIAKTQQWGAWTAE